MPQTDYLPIKKNDSLYEICQMVSAGLPSRSTGYSLSERKAMLPGKYASSFGSLDDALTAMTYAATHPTDDLIQNKLYSGGLTARGDYVFQYTGGRKDPYTVRLTKEQVLGIYRGEITRVQIKYDKAPSVKDELKKEVKKTKRKVKKEVKKGAGQLRKDLTELGTDLAHQAGDAARDWLSGILGGDDE